MKKCLFLLFVMLLVFSGSSAQDNVKLKHTYDSISAIRDVRLRRSDSLRRLGQHRLAFMWMHSASLLTYDLRNLVLMQQEKKVLLQIRLNEKTHENNAVKWSNDSLQLRLRLVEENRRRLMLERDSVRRQQKIHKMAMISSASYDNMMMKQAQNESAIHQLKKETQRRRLLQLFYWFVFLSGIFLAMCIYLYVRDREKYISDLKKKSEKLADARQKTLEARDKAQKAREEALKANMMKTVFIQNMSHEMRTPLNAIVGFSGLLTDSSMQFDSAQRQEFSNLIAKNSDLLITLIDDILDFSNLSSGKYKMKYTQTTLNEICDVAYTAVKTRSPEGVAMSFELPVSKEDNLVLWTDSSRVVQVLINYLTNACKNTTEGTIKLAYEVTRNRENVPQTVCFSVTDTGVGVPLEKAECIFKRFEKLDDFKQGNGFGLNICRTIAELLNARCWLDTTYTKGARFCFEIPAFIRKPEDSI